MEEPIFRPVSKDAAMKKTAMTLADVQSRIQWIEDNVVPRVQKIQTLNQELRRWWNARPSWSSDLTEAVFVAQVLTPLRQKYGTRPWPMPQRPPDIQVNAIMSFDELTQTQGQR